MRKKWTAHAIALAGILVFSALAMGKATGPAPVEAVERVDIVPVPSWSAYSLTPSMEYEVVGAIVLRDVNHATLLADLMDRAAAMGGHDIKNVRLSILTIDGARNVTVATAVAIRYTETLRDAEGNPLGLGGGVSVGAAPAAPAAEAPEAPVTAARGGRVTRWGR